MSTTRKPRARVVNGVLALVKKSPKHCAANRDGECTHPGCPQLLNWGSVCPQPDHPEEG